VPFGGSNGLVCFLRSRGKYCHNGMAFADHHNVGCLGSMVAIMAPSGGS
jgi:hypothetical protein